MRRSIDLQFGYPRPQLERAQWTPLNGRWKFSFDHDRRYRQPADIGSWPLSIEVPFSPESAASGIGDTGFHHACWYEREFEVAPDGKRVILHFGAVDYLACVWVNGQVVVTHQGGHTPFSADITFALKPNGPQILTVMAEDDPFDLT
ncbi:MAG TPA: glycoside hydrolase family 2, partial [Burkholderiales bacterium]|nr:glycoside hydrolase family 2 [Burkholderiales bacterium]